MKRRVRARRALEGWPTRARRVGAALAALLLVAGACERDGFEAVFDDAGPVALREEAIAFSQAFLATVDSGEIASTWPMVAHNVQERTGREVWIEAVEEARRTLGAFESRSSRRYGFTDQLANAPPGTYFVIEYDSAFSDESAVERVICFHQNARDWRASGYFVTTKR